MRRRLLLSIAILIGTAIVLVAGYWLMQPTPRINQESVDKIQIGMTEREVIDIIGVPAGNHGLGECQLNIMSGWVVFARTALDNRETKTWFGQDKGIKIDFADGKVAEKGLHDVWREYDSHFDMLCQMLRIREKKFAPGVVVY